MKEQMNTWLFQGNPARFDIDSYLGEAIDEIRWTVVQYANEIAIGDTVFIWKSKGADRDNAGIVAECQALTVPWFDASLALSVSLDPAHVSQARTPHFESHIHII